MKEVKKVVIIGAGFGGLNAAKTLANERSIELTVIDQKNHHLFQPLLYQVATAGLSPAEIASPIRSLLVRDNRRINVIMAQVNAVDLRAKTVTADHQIFSYDYLVLACGASHSYFGNDHWQQFAPGLKTIEQATEIRRRILTAFERAECEADPQKQREWLSFVVVGGGPTGVELAGALAEISRFTLSRDFHRIDSRRTRIILIEAGPRILPQFSASLSQRATEDLEKLGVTVWTSVRVTDINEKGVSLGAEFLQANTVLWAAGVKASSLNNTLAVDLDQSGRIKVNEYAQIPAFPAVFVIGDQAAFLDKAGQALPGVAPVAMQQGRYVAKSIVRLLSQKPLKAFHYFDKGQLATIGRRRAVVQGPHFQCAGLFAWIIWLAVHIFYLIGFQNRVFVMIQWFSSYVLFRRGARLIVDKEWRQQRDVD
jgi:NADH dehydrogenase